MKCSDKILGFTMTLQNGTWTNSGCTMRFSVKNCLCTPEKPCNCLRITKATIKKSYKVVKFGFEQFSKRLFCFTLMFSTTSGSAYRKPISTTILRLQEKTVLTELKDKWWKKERGGGMCQQKRLSQSEFGARSVGGIFLILVAQFFCPRPLILS